MDHFYTRKLGLLYFYAIAGKSKPKNLWTKITESI